MWAGGVSFTDVPLALQDDHILIEDDREPACPCALPCPLQPRLLHVHLGPRPEWNVDGMLEEQLFRLAVKIVALRLVLLDVGLVRERRELLRRRSERLRGLTPG